MVKVDACFTIATGKSAVIRVEDAKYKGRMKVPDSSSNHASADWISNNKLARKVYSIVTKIKFLDYLKTKI